MKNKNKKNIIIIIAFFVLAALTVGSFVGLKLVQMNQPTVFAPPEPTSGEWTGYYRHCYAELADDEKLLYATILQSVYSMPERIEVPALTTGDFGKVFEAISYDNPDLFCLSTSSTLIQEGKKIFFLPEYNMTYEEYSSKLAEANAIASKIASNAIQYTSDYERELYIHDYIINHCTYELNSQNVNDIYGCLVNAKASCEGYSRTFQYLLSAVGIDNRLITGQAADSSDKFIGHMWNYVIIDDNGYFTDITWDDPSTDGSVLRHTYFNVTTSDILVAHKEIHQTVPLCTTSKYNFFTYENAVLGYGDNEAFEESLENVIFNSRNRGYKCAELKFKSKEAVDWAVNAMFKENVIYNVYRNLGILDSIGENGVYYSTDDRMFTVCIYY